MCNRYLRSKATRRMNKLGNLIQDQWVKGSGAGTPLLHAINGTLIGHADTEGVDVESAYLFAREVGGPALRKMTFQGGRM